MIEVPQHLKGRDFTRLGSWSSDELKAVLDVADTLKEAQQAREPHELLPGRTLGMIFQKPSTRTRVSFEVGIAQLGGRGLYLAANDLQLGRGETIRDTGTVLSRYLDAIMIRTFEQDDVEELAEAADIPVINGLTDYAHPCQALADLMTIREKLGRLSGTRLAYLGDGNNVCVSLMVGAARFGIRKRLRATPTLSTRMSGRAWARRTKRRSDGATSLTTASTAISCSSPRTTPSSCIACRRTTARRSRRTCSTGRSRPCGTRLRTGCTHRRR
jgi:ornithine carbamoyltransferase